MALYSACFIVRSEGYRGGKTPIPFLIMPGSWVRVPPLLSTSQSLPGGWLDLLEVEVLVEVPISSTFFLAAASRAASCPAARCVPIGRVHQSVGRSDRTHSRPSGRQRARFASQPSVVLHRDALLGNASHGKARLRRPFDGADDDVASPDLDAPGTKRSRR